MVAVVIGWSLIVAISAGSRPQDDSWVGLPDLGTAVVLLMLTGVAVGLVMLLQQRSSGYAQGTPSGGMGTVLVVGLLAIAAFTAIGDRNLMLDESLEESPVEVAPGATADSERSGLPESTVAINESDLLVGLGVMISAGLAAWWLLRRRRAEVGPLPEVGKEINNDIDVEAFVQQLSAAAARGHGRAEEISDPRQSVLVAYSNLEQVVTHHGHSRHRHETANEHLNRVLGAIPVDKGPLVRLAGLYESVRFSDRVVTSKDRRAALSDLSLARDQLVEIAGGALATAPTPSSGSDR